MYIHVLFQLETENVLGTNVSYNQLNCCIVELKGTVYNWAHVSYMFGTRHQEKILLFAAVSTNSDIKV